MTEDSITQPDASPEPIATEPAPPFWFTQRIGGAIPLADEGYVSDAGRITNLKHNGVPGTVSRLDCRAGSWRARHMHLQDSHLLYVVSGEVHYWECSPERAPLPADAKPDIFTEGQQFFTPPMRPHAMYFPVDTILISMSDRTRTHEQHEADVVRLKVI